MTLCAYYVLTGNFLVFWTNSQAVEKIGAPEEIRTPDPQIRSLVLYPAELRALTMPDRIMAKRGGGP